MPYGAFSGLEFRLRVKRKKKTTKNLSKDFTPSRGFLERNPLEEGTTTHPVVPAGDLVNALGKVNSRCKSLKPFGLVIQS